MECMEVQWGENVFWCWGLKDEILLQLFLRDSTEEWHARVRARITCRARKGGFKGYDAIQYDTITLFRHGIKSCTEFSSFRVSVLHKCMKTKWVGVFWGGLSQIQRAPLYTWFPCERRLNCKRWHSTLANVDFRKSFSQKAVDLPTRWHLVQFFVRPTLSNMLFGLNFKVFLSPFLCFLSGEWLRTGISYKSLLSLGRDARRHYLKVY